MDLSCTFVFHNILNDFLPTVKKHKPIGYTGRSPATVKDVIEAIGVPHVEIGKIRINGTLVSFSYRLQPNDVIEVLPFETAATSPSPLAFLLDVHLGKLARLLRLLGFNTHYQTDYDDARIVALSLEQNSVVLTRDVGLLKHKVLRYGYWLRSQNPEEQVKEVVSRFALWDSIRPFSRCMACNGFIVKVEKETIQDTIPPGTRAYFQEFYRCGQCHKIYWKGTHYHKMLNFIERLRSFACQVGPPAL